MSQGVVNDLITLEELNEESILEVLRSRYESKLIYTYTGSILVAFNPFCVLDIYGQEVLTKYRSKRIENSPPHIYALAECAYATLNVQPQQSIIISGESGAGKSETTKLVLQYLTAVTSHKGQESWIEQQILEANTILESFGNAKTVRNNNSSRFGKFIQVFFEESNQISGASFNHYLLEKSRVARQAPGERNYHVFYELLKGANQQERQQYKLLTANHYYYLAQSGCIDIPNVNDAQSFSQLKLAMQVMNFDKGYQDCLYRILGAILTIGNIQFLESSDKESVSIHPAVQDSVDTVCELLKLDPASFVQIMTVKRLVVRNDVNLLPYKLSQALDNRDAVAKILYDALFDSILRKINFALAQKKAPAKQSDRSRFVGVLDIFGFEIFQANSFEQLCINFTNEKLQQVFVQLIFKFEQREYELEGIDWSALSFSDNVACIELIENKGGILAMLDEELKVPKGNDESWVEKLHNCHSNNPYYFKPRTGKQYFGIKHYAGEVSYCSTSFLEKNRDAVPEELIETFLQSQLPLVVDIIKSKTSPAVAAAAANGPPSDAPKSSKSEAPTRPAPAPPTAKKTAGSSFKQSLSQLVGVLESTSTQFVRCIKPNQEKAALSFNRAEVLNQLRYTGMLDTIRIRSDGYPKRYGMEFFTREYRFLLDPSVLKSRGPGPAIAGMISAQGLSKADIQIGKTKVFLKQATASLLTSRNNEFLVGYVVKLQAFVRMIIARQRYRRQLKAASVLNRVIRGYKCRIQYRRIRKATTVLQAFTRGWMARCFYAYLLQKKNGGVAVAPVADPSRSAPGAAAKPANNVAKAANNSNMDELFGLLSSAGDPSMPADVNQNNATNRAALDLSQLMDQLGAHIDNVRKKVKDVNEKQRDAQRMADMGNKFARFVEKQMNEKDSEKVNPDSPQLSLEVYASRYCNKYCKYKLGTQGKRKPMEHTELLCYEAGGDLGSALHRIYDNNLNEISLQCYKSLFKLASAAAKPSKKNSKGTYCEISAHDIDLVKEFITVGIQYSALRDELYAQLIKVTNRKPAESSSNEYKEIEMLWFVAFLSSSCFPPTKKLSKVWLAYVMRTIRQLDGPAETATIVKYLKKIEQSLKHIMVHGSRRLAPSCLEIYCYREGANLPCKINLPNGHIKSIAITSTTTAMEAIKTLSNSIDLRDPTGWAIFQGMEGKTHVKATEYICDLLSDWELAVDERMKTREQATELILNSKQNALFLLKRLFFIAQAPNTDPVAIGLLYSQLSAALLKGEFEIPNLEVGSQLAAMQCHVNDGAFDDSIKYPNNFGLKYIPKHLWQNEQVKLVVQSIFVKYMELSQAGPVLQTMNLFIETLKRFPQYGVSRFEAVHDGFWAYTNSVIIAVSSQSVTIEHPKTKELMFKFAYKDLKAVALDAKTDMVTIQYDKAENMDETASSGAQGDSMRFKCTNAADLVSLIRDYSPIMAAKKSKDTNLLDAVDTEFLEKELEKARWKMLKFKLLNLPGPETSHKTGIKPKNANVGAPDLTLSGSTMSPLSPANTGTLANPFATLSSRANGPAREALPFGTVKLNGTVSNQATGRHLGDGKLSKLTQRVKSKLTLRGNAQDKDPAFEQEEYEPTKEEQDAMYSVADWSFSKTVIPASLRSLNPEDGKYFEQSKWSVQLYTILLIYTGIHPGTLPIEENSMLPYGHIVKSMMKRCLETPETVDEFFLQLIKLTTNFPQADAPPCLEYWKILAVACGCMMPCAAVVDLLKAHLAKYAACPKYYHVDRTKEAEFAKFAQKAFRRAQLGFKRTSPPSVDEIYFCSHMVPMRLRVKFPDNQFRSFSIWPSTTCREVLDLIDSKQKIAKLIGWDLFERFSGVERPIGRNEIIADLIYKWENFKRGQPLYEKFDVEFVFRRRFYVSHLVPSTNQWEEHMMHCQAMNDFKNGLIPVERPEAVYLTALLIQSASGNVAPDKPLNYGELAVSFLPPAALGYHTGFDIDVAKIHGSLRGVPYEKAESLFMEYLRTWQFFGGSIYEVSQNYTNELPPKLWLIVDINGVHLLPVFQKMALASYPFSKIVNYSSSPKTLLLVAGDLYRGTKYVFQTIQPHIICKTIKSYADLSKTYTSMPAKTSASPNTNTPAKAPGGVKFR